ncbi:hypothetical protein HY949_05680, partial [Candidatus Gottesmanbacteria bacterium]|nr:hypothetical protein [Candidatus Gottesmanbacteria bacterium]
MLQALSDFISKVTRGEKLTIDGVEAQWKKVAELTPGLMIAVPTDVMEGSDVTWDEIVSIRRLPPERVWDIEVEGTHNFVANGIFAHNTTGKALAVFNETGDQNILVASASGTTQFSVGRTGIVTAAQFQDQADSTYFLDPAASGTSLKINGDVELTAGGTISSTANNNITIDAGSGTVCIGTAG